MPPPARSSLFRNPSADQSPPQSLFSPPPSNNISSNGLFSPSPASSPNDRFRSPQGNNSLFAGVTPAAKSSSARFGGAGGGGLFGSGAPTFAPPAPTFSFNAPSAQQQSQPPRVGGGSSITRSTRRGSASKPGRFLSPTDGDDEDETVSPRIYEDDSRGDPTPQDEDSIELEDEAPFDETMEDEVAAPRHGAYEEGIIENAIQEPGTLIIRAEELMEQLNNLIAPRKPPPGEDDDYDEDMDMEGPIPPSLEEQQQHLSLYSKMFLGALESHLSQRGTKLHRAFTVASLVLPLHHSTANTAEVLRKWLYASLPKPTRQQLQAVKAYAPSCACAPDFWETVQCLTLRGEVQEAVELLRNAKWDLMSTEAPEPPPKLFGGDNRPSFKKYTPDEIEAIEEATETAIRVLSATPGKGRSSYQPSSSQIFPNPKHALDSGGSAADWRIWRGSVIKAFEELKTLFSGDDAILEDETDDSFSQIYNDYHPGTGSFGLSFGGSQSRAKKAKLPQEIYHSFRYIYDVLRGDPDTITQLSDHWQEGVVGLMMWARVAEDEAGDEQDDEDLDLDMEGLTPSEYQRLISSRKQRELDRLQKIVEDHVVNGDLPINMTEPVEVAAAGMMAGDPAFLSALGELSLLVAAAVVEIGSLGNWIQREGTAKKEQKSNELVKYFDDEELAVLEHGGNGVDTNAALAEDTLRKYASALFGLPFVDKDAHVEGWELGVGVLARVHKGKELSGRLLSQLPLTSKTRVEGLLTYCAENSLPETASKIAFTYAESLRDSTAYGDQLHFYALSDSRDEMHAIITTLIEKTLTEAAPFPPADELDPALRKFLTSPEAATTDLLRFELSGYATLRAYFDSINTNPKAAARALAATIRGAGEKIDDGVYDEQWNAAMEAWCLPCLFARVLPLMATLELSDLFDVLKVVGDWEELRESDEVVKRGVDVLKQAGKKRVDGSWVNIASGKEEVDVGKVVRVLRLEASRVIAKTWLKGGVGL